MEQLIPIIEFVKKNRFWLTCGLVALLLCGTWFLATRKLADAREKSIKDIQSSKRTADGILKTGAEGVESIVRHPNTSTQDGMSDRINAAAESVIAAWRMRREAQDPVLTWPDEDVLASREMIDLFKQFDPVEAFPGLADDTKQEVRKIDQYCAIYQEFIPNRMDELCDIIGAKWKHSKKKKSNSRRSPEPPAENPASEDEAEVEGNEVPAPAPATERRQPGDSNQPVVVEWSDENQLLWKRKLTEFKGVDGQTGVDDDPTPIQVAILQQDLWLLEAFFHIVKDINGGADANDLAVIKRIEHIAFGREARGQLGSLVVPDQQLAPGGGDAVTSGTRSSSQGRGGGAGGRPPGYGAGGRPAGYGGAGGPSRGRGAGGSTEEEDVFDPWPGNELAKWAPIHGRYVDVNFAPITAEDIQKVLTAEELPEQYLELIVAKRVPFRISVRMSDHKIDDFIAACGNSPFAFEIWQVRINRPQDPVEWAAVENRAAPAGAGGSRGGGRGNRGGMTFGARSSSGGMSAAPPGANPGARGSAMENAGADASPVHLRTSYDINVEFYGVVKVYNPVNEALIRKALEANQ